MLHTQQSLPRLNSAIPNLIPVIPNPIPVILNLIQDPQLQALSRLFSRGFRVEHGMTETSSIVTFF